ncbi:uncharacterized protein EI90DRAFT_3157601 [Cantharellus anzutake]|uniref:uncharacterized protein n=1 Tax=Cantharellus anzutake TaxID=1750568 RepID=UPI001908F9AF|nr:uncharacterized protein EI90DRAFT_3157601 [Cantharellus anzutake]KAF8323487.1 hypothetical protein EI90DRAFT_3157601 [Cantharellus anzutake]
MGLFSWFSKKPSENYEEILANLSMEISSRQTRLTEIVLRERRSTLWATLYTLAGWTVYSFIWHLDLVPNFFKERTRSNMEIERIAQMAPVVIGPLIALFLRRIIQLWYRQKGAGEEKTLKKLLTQQRTIIEDLKKKTNYYSTRNLIERYDLSPAAPQTPQGSRGPEGSTETQLRRRALQNQSGGLGPNPPSTPSRGPMPGVNVNGAPTGSRGSPFVATPPQPPRRMWLDKVADALLGDENSTPGLDPAKSKYALVCRKCSTHNGLVVESLWEDTQYICPKCGHFNPAPRSKRRQSSLPKPPNRLAQPDFLSASSLHDDDDERLSQSSRSISRERSSREMERGEVGDPDKTQDSVASSMDVDR